MVPAASSDEGLVNKLRIFDCGLMKF